MPPCFHLPSFCTAALDAPGATIFNSKLAWLSKCRAIMVRCDKKVSNYIGLIQLACALLWYRRQRQLKFWDSFL